jgi:hypothetical protein
MSPTTNKKGDRRITPSSWDNVDRVTHRKRLPKVSSRKISVESGDFVCHVWKLLVILGRMKLY